MVVRGGNRGTGTKERVWGKEERARTHLPVSADLEFMIVKENQSRTGGSELSIKSLHRGETERGR